MRRGLISFAVFLILGAVGYAASPLWAAWQLKSAVATGDVATVRACVVWDSVRQSMRRSMSVYAGLDAAAAPANGRIGRPTLWGRLKRSFGHRMLDQFIATYVTPEGFIRLHRMRTRRQQPDHFVRAGYAIPGRSTTDATPPRLSQAKAFLKRLKRVAFTSPTEVAIELADQTKPDRHFVLQFGLRNAGWLLTGIEVVRPAPIAVDASGRN